MIHLFHWLATTRAALSFAAVPLYVGGLGLYCLCLRKTVRTW